VAGVAMAVKHCEPTIFQLIREGFLLGTGLSWDIDGGAVEDQAPGSSALLNLRTTTNYCHSFASSWASAPDGTWEQDKWKSLLFLLDIGTIGDGVVSEDSARGGIDSRAYSFDAGLFHTQLPEDDSIANQVLALLEEPVGSSGSGDFADFPPSSIAVSDATIIALAYAACVSAKPKTANPQFGTWLAVSGLTNGASSVGGQHLIVAVASTDGRPLSSAMFMTPQGSLIHSTPPFQADFVMPTNVIGPQNLVIVGKDTNGEMSLLSFVLSVTTTSVLQRIEVTPPTLPIATRLPEALRVFGDYSDGVRREITSGSTGTQYASTDPSHVRGHERPIECRPEHNCPRNRLNH
jgi:hypothetical protein